MEEAEEKPKTAAEADAEIARRLEAILRVVREDEAKAMRIIEMRRLRRRAEQAGQKK